MIALLDKINGKLKLPIDVWFFFLFLLSFSLTIRKVLFYSLIERTFNEYTGIYVYLSDIFLIITISLWFLLVLSHGVNIVSRIKLWITCATHDLSTALPGLLVIFSFISIAWAINKDIALFRSIKLLEYYGLYLYIIFRLVPFLLAVTRLPRVQELFHARPVFEKCSTWNNSRIYEVEHLKNLQNGTIDTSNACHPEHSEGSIAENKNNTRFFATAQNDNLVNFSISKCSTCLADPLRQIKAIRRAWNIFFVIIIFSGLTQSIIAIVQFIAQKSIGLTFIKESLIAPDMPGVAKIIFNGEPYIRAYGLMPHPNILGGFLLFTIIITVLYYKILHYTLSEIVPRMPRVREMFHMEHFENLRGGTSGVFRDWNISRIYGLGHLNFLLKKWVFDNIWLIYAIIFIQLVALLFTFSKSAIIGFLIAVLYLKLKNVPRPPRVRELFHACPVFERCSTWNISRIYGVEQFENLRGGTFLKSLWSKYTRRAKLLSGLIIVILAILITQYLNLYYFLVQPIKERLLLLGSLNPFRVCPVFENCSTWNIILGSGIGQFIPSLSLFNQKVLLAWQYQPIHNVYLLIYSELGLLGAGLFIWFIWHIFHGTAEIVPYGTISVPDTCYPERSRSLPAGRQGSQDSSTPLPASPAGGRSAQNDKEGDSCSILYHDSYDSSIVYFKAILLGFLFIMLFDHYFWDIQQGSLMLWIVFGLIAGLSRVLYNMIKNSSSHNK